MADHLADVVIAGVLGAAVLALVLMARCIARNTRLITELRAELTAQKILTLTGNLPAAAGAEAEVADTVPVRARGHLALLAGTEGGTAPSARFRDAWSTRYRTLTITVTAAALVGGGITAVTLCPTSIGRDRGEAPPAMAPGIPGKKEQQAANEDCDDETVPRTSGPDPDRQADLLPVPRLIQWNLEARSARAAETIDRPDPPPALLLAS